MNNPIVVTHIWSKRYCAWQSPAVLPYTCTLLAGIGEFLVCSTYLFLLQNVYTLFHDDLNRINNSFRGQIALSSSNSTERSKCRLADDCAMSLSPGELHLPISMDHVIAIHVRQACRRLLILARDRCEQYVTQLNCLL